MIKEQYLLELLDILSEFKIFYCVESIIWTTISLCSMLQPSLTYSKGAKIERYSTLSPISMIFGNGSAPSQTS